VIVTGAYARSKIAHSEKQLGETVRLSMRDCDKKERSKNVQGNMQRK